MKQKFAYHKFLAAAAVATTLAFSSAPAHGATLVVDNVEDINAYTFTGYNPGGNKGNPGPASFGLTSLAGTNYANITTTNTVAVSGSIRKTTSFGPSFTVAAGTYTLSMYIGEADISRRTFTTVAPVLTTIGGTEFTDKTIITSYVDPNTTTTAEWVLTEVEYEIASDSLLIGQQFTWGFDYTKTATGTRLFGAWDAVTVDFVAAIPEPSAALLGGLGMLALLRRRR